MKNLVIAISDLAKVKGVTDKSVMSAFKPRMLFSRQCIKGMNFPPI